MCIMMKKQDCMDCPFVTCVNHPQFYLALQCAKRKPRGRARADTE